MMNLWGWIQRCRQTQARCRELEAENRQLKERNAWLERSLQEAQAKNTQLAQAWAAAKKNSSNSSKPPSSDLVKPPAQQAKGKQRAKRSIGGQKGHPKHEHVPFAPEQVDERITYGLRVCPVNPAHRIVPAEDRNRTLQQIELAPKPIIVTEHIAQGIWCQDCHCYHDAPFPLEIVRAGLFGPRLTALAVYSKARLHASYSGIHDLLRDVLGINVSRGYVAKLLRKASQAFGGPHGELIELLPEQLYLNTDETGHKENGVRYWIWCFRAARFVVFKIDRSRGTKVLMEILGEEFKGILGCDYYAAYRKYARLCSVLVQFCLAHLIREVKYLCEFPDLPVQRYGKKLLAGLQALFHVLHRKEELTEKAYAAELAAAQEQIWEAAMEPKAFPERFGGAKMHRLIANLVRRFDKHGEAYFQFITNPQIDPTNNVVEQAMRFVVIDRHITQGTRSWRGRQICERMWTVMATCALQKRSPFHWMCQAIEAWFQGRPVPSLLVDSS
jgi:transposase